MLDEYAQAFRWIFGVLLAAIVVWGIFHMLADVNWPFLLNHIWENAMKILLSFAFLALLVIFPLIVSSMAELLDARARRKDKQEKKT